MIKKNWEHLNTYTGSLSQNVTSISCLSLNCSDEISVCHVKLLTETPGSCASSVALISLFKACIFSSMLAIFVLVLRASEETFLRRAGIFFTTVFRFLAIGPCSCFITQAFSLTLLFWEPRPPEHL